MSVSRRICETLLVVATVATAARAQDAAAEEVARLFEQGRFDRALTESEYIEDPALRYAWRFHVLFQAGDLSEALRTAMEGIRAAPASLELHQNALSCALTLGLGRTSEQLAESLLRAIDAAQLDAQTRDSWLAAHERLATQARESLALENAADAAAQRSKRIVFGAAALALLAMAWAGRARPVARA